MQNISRNVKLNLYRDEQPFKKYTFCYTGIYFNVENGVDVRLHIFTQVWENIDNNESVLFSFYLS